MNNNSSELLKKYIKGKVAVFIDAANISKSIEDIGYKINYRKLRSFLKSDAQLFYLGYYSVHFDTPKHKEFLKALEAKKYQTITKPLKIIANYQSKTGIRKANFDVEIAVDAMDLIDKYDTMILFSGDSDFDYLVRRLRQKGKMVIVMATRYHIAKELIKNCNKYFDLKKFEGIFLGKRVM